MCVLCVCSHVSVYKCSLRSGVVCQKSICTYICTQLYSSGFAVNECHDLGEIGIESQDPLYWVCEHVCLLIVHLRTLMTRFSALFLWGRLQEEKEMRTERMVVRCTQTKRMPSYNCAKLCVFFVYSVWAQHVLIPSLSHNAFGHAPFASFRGVQGTSPRLLTR